MPYHSLTLQRGFIHAWIFLALQTHKQEKLKTHPHYQTRHIASGPIEHSIHTRESLLASTYSLSPILAHPRSIHNFDLLAQAHHRAPLIPPSALPRTLILSLRISKTLARNHNRAPHPSPQLRDALAISARKVLGDIDELRRKVFQNLHVAGLGCEGQDARGMRDEGEGLLVEGVEGFGVRCLRGRDAGRDGLEFAAGGGDWGGDLGVG